MCNGELHCCSVCYGDQIAERVKCVAGTINACFILDRKCENSITPGRRRYR
jgi:hypothetical protein